MHWPRHIRHCSRGIALKQERILCKGKEKALPDRSGRAAGSLHQLLHHPSFAENSQGARLPAELLGPETGIIKKLCECCERRNRRKDRADLLREVCRESEGGRSLSSPRRGVSSHHAWKVRELLSGCTSKLLMSGRSSKLLLLLGKLPFPSLLIHCT